MAKKDRNGTVDIPEGQKPGINLIYEGDGDVIFEHQFPPRGPRGKGAKFSDEQKEDHYKRYLEIGKDLWSTFWPDRDDLAGLNRGDVHLNPETGKPRKTTKGKIIKDPGNQKLMNILKTASEEYADQHDDDSKTTLSYETKRAWEMAQMASQEKFLREHGAGSWPYRFKHKLAQLPNGPDKKAIIEEIDKVRNDQGDTTAYNQLSRSVNRKQPSEMMRDLRNRDFSFIIQARGNEYLDYVENVHEQAREELARELQEAYEWVDQNMLKRIQRMAEDLGASFD